MLHQIAIHTGVQDRLREEINRVETEDGGLSYETITKMPYLDQVFYESMRLNSTVPFMLRQCTTDTSFALTHNPSGPKVNIKKGDALHIPFHSLHMDPDYYQDPERFDPDRFSETNGGVARYRDKGVYIPFGAVPRQCLGMRFAQTQIKVGLVQIVKNFKLNVNVKTEKVREIDPKNVFNLPKGGIWLDYTPIKF